MTRTLFILLLLSSLTALAQAQQPGRIATDYEWQLAQPGKTWFRDKLAVGQIALVSGRKEKATGELLQVLTDIAFVPGDTTRYLAAAFRVVEGERIHSEVLVDAEELPELIKSARYIAQTALAIQNSTREETDISYHTRAGFSLEFKQIGMSQTLQVALPDPFSDGEVIRSLSADQLKMFSDLLDLTIYSLNHQHGADLKVDSPK
ncbi:MAG: hypothetical protein H6505_05845 [Calditrichaeota bacterium]|nr:hypothetical protein [Calditrichota bacterium]